MADRGSGSCQRFGMPAMRILGGACGATVIALGVYDITQDSSDIGVVVNNVYRSQNNSGNTSEREALRGGAATSAAKAAAPPSVLRHLLS